MIAAGTLRHAVLAELEREPGRAWEIYHRLEDVLGVWWGVNDGQVQQILETAVRNGLAETTRDASDRAVYSLADAGRDSLQRWREGDAGEPLPLRSTMFLRLLYTDEPNEALLAALEDQLHMTRRMTRSLRQTLEATNPGQWRAAALRGVLTHLVAEGEWLAETRDAVESGLDAKPTRRRRRRS